MKVLVRFGALALVTCVSTGVGVGQLAAATWMVDGGSPACSDSGPGTDASPFCTIKPAGKAAVAGDAVLVKPGTYREQVTPPASGAPGSPITYQAAAPGVLILGTLDLSDPALWSATATTAWSTPFAPPSAPKQVFLDGQRLSVAPGAAETTPDSFFYDPLAMILYVDIGGGNPAVGHTIEAGARTYGFLVSGRNDIVIDGFETRGQNTAGVKVTGSTSITVSRNSMTYAGSYGIYSETVTGPLFLDANAASYSGSVGIRVDNTSGASITNNTSHHNGFHGIGLTFSSNNTIAKNTCYANLKPSIRSAVGIDIDQSSNDNLIQANTLYSNQDSGSNVRGGSTRNLFVRNLSYRNGDHGYDTRNTTGNTYISNTSYRNFKDGFSIEGNANYTVLADNIAVDNGLTSNEYNLYVDGTSTTGFSSDYDLFWNSSPGVSVRFDLVSYPTFSDFKTATGYDPHGLDADPLFVDAAANDFHLRAASPALDSADSSAPGFSSDDHDGVPPIEVTTVPDSGAGPFPYADRGAFEYDAPPTASLSVTPPSGAAPLPVTADASRSTDADTTTPIASYTFDFGDGTLVGPQPGATAGHTYTYRGTFTVTVMVKDTAGHQGNASGQVNVSDTPPVAKLTVTPTSGFRPLFVTANASASTDSDPTPIAGYTFDFGDGTLVGPQAGPTAGHTYTQVGTFTVTVTVTDTGGLKSTAAVRVTVKDNPPVAKLTLTPTSGFRPLLVTANASASTDSDPTPIAGYTFDFGDGTLVGPQAGATASHTYTQVGTFKTTVTVADTAGLKSSATVQVTVKDNPPAAKLTLTPTSGFRPLLVTANASASTDSDPTPIATYTFDFGDGTLVGPQAGATASHTYTQVGTFKTTVTVADTAGLKSTATVQVAVKDNPPAARLKLTPTSGKAPLVVTASAAGSIDADPTPIASYTFDFGDGTIVGPQPEQTATHTFLSAGTYKVIVIVTDTAGLSSRAAVDVKVTL